MTNQQENGGWVKLYRKLYENPRSRDPEWLAVWVYLLCSATHKPMEMIFDGQRITLKPGQLISGRISISEKTGVNPSKVYRVLELLKIEQQIEQQTGSKSSIFTVLKWDSYQSIEQQSEQQSSSKRAASEHKQEEEEVKNKSTYPTRETETGRDIPTVEQAIAETQKQLQPHLIPDEEFTRYVYEDWYARGGKDGNGIVVAFNPYVLKRWRRESADWRSGSHNGKRKAGGQQQRPLTGAEQRKLDCTAGWNT